MNAISLYVSASRLLFNQSDTDNPNYSDLYRLIPYLRQSLSCTVCANLLIEPYTAENSICQHHVCKRCIGGRKNLKPTCLTCKNYHNYQANTQLRILLQCYNQLCNYILATPSVYNSMHNYVHVDAFSNGNNEAQNLAELIDEGAQFHDDYKSNSGLAKAKISILPCIFTTTSSVSSSHNSGGSSSCSVGITTNALTNKTTFHSSTAVNAPFIHTTTSNQLNCSTSASSSLTMASSSSKTNDGVAMMVNTSLAKTTPIKTMSNGTALYSVLYTGTGNKITIKRKTDDNNIFTTARNTISTKDVLNMLSRNPTKITQHSQIQQLQTQKQVKPMQQIIQAQPHFKRPAITLKTNKTLQKRKGCRCGNATVNPGKLTCCGQRCPCYVESKSCIDCKCRGCRNPHRIDGLKVRPQLPQLTCLVQMKNQPFEKSHIDVPISTACTPTVPKIKQEILSIPNVIPGSSRQIMSATVNPQLSRTNETIEYISNDLDDNIQVVNVYTTTHMPDISTTLPTIIMQDEPSILNNSAPTTDLALHTLPSDSYSLIGEDLIKHSFSDEESSDNQSDVEIDL
ncbi:E3 ubiquitin-protein ligase MSL2 [Contarinia nasturtii]|uniref:E3 ubiquitin-protein ligase MSL2 n=1 Tax=Contarinia nasturtii TaxID=265458 RepID=UPI0012D4A15A|nr:E3 ubiquitin-protein ligase MSL2 [Contarinia nasturtii]XP_031632367.1 E3 ubiquitin-protein ligase MSL2 [Contarinia nasturtii]XP_031632368.1 E3 ubiquitin-protein ligase MSL2 [Contarinia nasturtii]XP_031632369.1 E3 ubiquitin-protein ligase MSL2 [Contarinia nasturtii]XP_031632370.1 E3 ubiquitin-protein ligase MSL2 [Contarinia nasturtii]XP_031632371.1 E3 ubiquitin-protein ligase MSL2 [Contarinia nasturtii]XP_031632372.1 E3 ubiquitin-protein ligase MSL2 [Contarinia nasturtii]XP_031632374.1 E3 